MEEVSAAHSPRLIQAVSSHHPSLNPPPSTLPTQLNHAIHAALILRGGVPPQFSSSRVAHGVLRLEDWHQFALSLTLESVADPATAPWRLLDVQFLLPRVRVCGCGWWACVGGGLRDD